MKILITGCNGFLGSTIIKKLSNKGYEIIGTSLNEKKQFNKIYFEKGDLLDFEFVKSIIRVYDPDVIINTAASTDVDFCERFPEEAKKLNVVTAENIAKAIEREDVKLIHISSDQLFNGANSYYSEETQPSPINVYGKTKVDAEKFCLESHKNTIVVRTDFFGWSPKGHKSTFAEWVINSLKEGNEINMFNNVFFSPIEVSLLADCIEKLFTSDYKGILNISGRERISKYSLGIKIAEEFGFDPSFIKPIEINQAKFSAVRPLDMSLSVLKYEEMFCVKLPNITESIKIFKENFPNKIKNLILGAGLSGLSLAYHFEKLNEKDYLLLESSEETGGLCRSIRKGGFTFDLAVHMLHLKKEESSKIVKSLLDDELNLIERKAGIFLNGKVIPYPLQYNLYHFDEEARKELLAEIIELSNNFDRNKCPKNFYEWIKMGQGEGIARYFMVPYNQKCYNLHPREITSNCGGNYIPSPEIKDIIEGANTDKSKEKVGYNYQFIYPKKGGIDLLIKSFAKSVKNIKLKEKVLKINLTKKMVFTEKDIYSFCNLINTIPLKKMIEIIADAPEGIENAGNRLKYNKICTVFLGVNKSEISPYQWLYVPQKEVLFYRLSFPSNYSKEMVPIGMSSICAEYSYTGDRIFTDNELIDKTIEGLIQMGLITNKDEIIFKDIIEVNPGYVIFDFNKEKNLKIIEDYLVGKNVQCIGRYGKWEYSSMEEAMLYGKETAEKLTGEN
jgi:dTDP-4-dehydrorhamnose reductase